MPCLFFNCLLTNIFCPITDPLLDLTINKSINATTATNLSNQFKKSPSVTAASGSSSIPTPSVAQNPGYKRPRQIFTLQQEDQLAAYVRDTANYYSGLSSKEVRILAFVYGVCNQVDMPAGWLETHQASFDWCLGFIKRNKLSPMILSGHSYNSNVKPKATVQLPKPQQNIAVVSNNTNSNGAAEKMDTSPKNNINGNNQSEPIEIDE